MTSPLPVSVVMGPGTTAKVDIRIKNTGNQTESIRTGVMSFTAYGDTGKPQLMEGKEEDEYLKWVTFSEPTFTLPVNQWKTVTATITAPSYAANGYYYALTFRRNQEVVTVEDPQSVLKGGVATLVLVDVSSSTAKRELSSIELTVDKKFYEYLPTTFNVKVHNSGNVHLAPVGSIFIDHANQHDLAILSVNKDKGYILPGTNRVFTSVWKDGFPVLTEKVENGQTVLDEKGKPKHKLSWDFNKTQSFRIGRYKASAMLLYDDGTRDIPLTAEVSFWVFPWKLILGALAVLLVVGYGVFSIVRGIWRRTRSLRKA